MANIKITDLNNFADPNSTDVLPIVDVAEDETKKVSIGNLMKSAFAGTAALPGVAFAVDEDTGMYRNASDQLAFATGGVERILIDGSGVVTIAGDLTVNGTTTTIDTTTLIVEDKNIEMGAVDTPSDTTADGGGITLKGATDKTLNWVNSTDSWTSSENVDLASGKTYKIAGTDVLSGSTLGSGVTGSSLTSVGTITTGVWNGTALTAAAIGADAINGSKIADDSIDSEHYVDGSIDNVHVSASAAISGTKISADFGAQDLTVDTNVLHVDATNDRVGVGTASPQTVTHIFAQDPILRIQDSSTAIANAFAAIQLAESGTGGVLGNYWQIALEGDSGTSTDHLTFKDGTGERLRIDSSGRLLVGTNTSLDTGGLFQVKSNTDGIINYYEGENTTPVRLRLTKSRGATTAAIDDDGLGEITFRGRDTSNNLRSAAAIAGEVDAAPGSSSVPGRLVFSTTADGASSPTERMRIDSEGNINATVSTTGGLKIGPTADNGARITTYQGSTNNNVRKIEFEAQEFIVSTGAPQGQATTEAYRVDGVGRLLVGTNSARTDLVRPHINIEAAGNAGMTIIRNENSASGGQLEFGKSRGTAVGASTSVSSGDELGMIRFRGADGTDMATEAARISGMVDGTPGSDDIPGRLAFYTRASGGSSVTERMRISSTGLHTITASNNSTAIQIRDASNYAGQLVTATDGTFEINARTDTTFTRTGSNTESMRIDSSGRLLVGTSTNLSGSANRYLQVSNSNPFVILHHNGNNPAANTTLAGLEYGGQAGGTYVAGAFIRAQTDGNWASGDAPTRLVFSTTANSASSPTERMRLNSSGYLKVAYDGNYKSSTAAYHEFTGDAANSYDLRIFNDKATPLSQYILDLRFNSSTPNNGNARFIDARDSTAGRFYVLSNGGIGNYQSNDSNLCDEREKKNIETLDSTWSCLKNWDLKKFHYNEDADTDDKRYGVIAQQVAPHCPEVITDWVKQRAEEAVLDDDGNVVTPAKEEIVRMGVKEQQMMWMAIKALQEAQTRIETLEAEVAALKGA